MLTKRERIKLLLKHMGYEPHPIWTKKHIKYTCKGKLNMYLGSKRSLYTGNHYRESWCITNEVDNLLKRHNI